MAIGRVRFSMGKALVVVLWVALCAIACADPREVESAELKEEFGDEFEERVSRTDESHDKKIVLQLEHNVASTKSADGFEPRGTVEIVYSASSPRPKVSFNNVQSLSEVQVERLQTMLQKNAMYTIRARADPADPSSPYVLASVPMCMLVGTRLREDITFHLSTTDQLVAMEYLTPYAKPSACAETQQRSLQSVKFFSQGNALKPQHGPAPPKQIVLKRESAPKGVQPPKGAEKQEGEEQQSFVRKYWYIILPIVIFTLFGGDPGAEGGAQAGGPGGAGASSGGGGARRR